MSDHTHHHGEHDLIDAILDRREFLRLAGASVALAGLDGCARLPAEHILPYVDNRPELTPGVAQYYTTAMCVDGYATGLIVEAHTGRPTKVEGNPDHPASLGASGPQEQASVLQVYDPDRAKHARIGARQTDAREVVATLASHIRGGGTGARGAGLHLLIEPTSSPLDEELLGRVLAGSPDAHIHMYAPFASERGAAATVRQYDLSSADVILAIDSDFLATGPMHLRYARQFADGRRLERPTDPMNRLYVVETGFSSTGLVADHRFAMRPSDIGPLMRSLLAVLRSGGGAPSNASWLAAVARDLTAHRGRSVVLVGDQQSADVRAIGDAINAAIGAEARTTWTVPNPLIGAATPVGPLSGLIDALHSNAVDTLVIVGGNPCYASPRALGLSELVRAVPTSAYLGLYENETAREVKSFIPMSHYLERWGDARAYDGTLSIVQPLLVPLYPSMGPAELYASLAGPAAAPTTSYDLLRASWAKRISDDTGAAWTDALQRGVVTGTAFQRSSGSAPVVASDAASQSALARGIVADAPGQIQAMYVVDPKVHDGAFSNNGWLQELPATITQLTWGNAALVSPATAHRVGIESGDLVKVSAGQRSLELVALVVPGHANDAVSVHFGYGRTGAESVARDVGANAYALWPALGVRFEPVTIQRSGGARTLAFSQTQATMENGEPVRTATLEAYRASPNSVGQRSGRVLSLYPQPAPPVGMHGDNQWAMTIDLGTCIGCGACVVACQAENNIPVVGAEQVQKGRAMQWIHVDRYFAEHEADGDAEALVQPMLCQHCEKAPCEYVCPVGATVHSADGLNEMVYNRCVGTRFCSNNCPYKVRRFNWFDFNKELSETELMVKNPNVSVRERGVMEKCTFCVQRIREADIAAGREGRTLHGSDVTTACQQACPTNAIVFGSLNDASSEMVRRRNQPRSYSVLAELGTEPRVQYLARIRNPNPELSHT